MMPSAAPNKLDPISRAKAAVKRLLVQAAVFSCFVNLLMLTGPIYMLQMYDRVLISRSTETLVVITGLTVVLFIAMGLLDYARGALLARAGAYYEQRLKPVIFDLSMEQARLGSAHADHALKDLRQIRQFVASPALTAVFDAPWTPFFMFLVFMLHWALGLVAILGLGVLLALAVINERSSREANMKSHNINSQTDQLAISAMRNAAATDSMGMRKPLRKRWLTLGVEGSDYTLMSTDTIGGLTAATKAARLFLQSAILGVGAFLAIKGEVTPGAMIAASIITGRALAPVEIVTGQWRNFALTSAAYGRLKELLTKMPPEVDRTALPAPKGSLSVEKLFCQPEGAKKLVIKGISFAIQAGETVGIIGPSAAGKSTLARALVGVETIRAGDVRIDGASISQWRRDALGPHLGYLPQDIELFAGTAAENISRFGDNPDATRIIAAAQAAGAHEMILNFADGYDTQIGERGHHISAGQRQRLALARALYGDPAIVVLDEPNSNLDGEGDAALAQAVQNLKARKATTIIVAHRPSAIAMVDKLLLLVEGEIKAFGPRDEVLKQIAPQQIATRNRPQPQAQGGASGAA